MCVSVGIFIETRKLERCHVGGFKGEKIEHSDMKMESKIMEREGLNRVGVGSQGSGGRGH